MFVAGQLFIDKRVFVFEDDTLSDTMGIILGA
jgi:hypothetical protein